MPVREQISTHVFHQYTVRVKNNKRNELKAFLTENGVPTSVFYPVPLYRQKAFENYVPENFTLTATEKLCEEVLSLPIHTEMDEELLNYIAGNVKDFFTKSRSAV